MSAQALRLFHIVGSKKDRGAVINAQLLDMIPYGIPRQGIEADRGLIQEEQAGAVP